MSEWWTYTLSDFLLFAPRTYYRLFELHNAAVWPAQIAALAAGVAVAVLLRRPGEASGRVIAALLAACWLAVGYGFLLMRYATINWAAGYFAAAFALQAALLLTVGLIVGRSAFSGSGARAGPALVLFGLVIQPLIGPLVGRPWSQVELFGIAPDPTATATLGAVLAAGRSRWLLMPIPVLWCAVSGLTLWAMDAPDAFVMPAVALVTIVLLARGIR